MIGALGLGLAACGTRVSPSERSSLGQAAGGSGTGALGDLNGLDGLGSTPTAAPSATTGSGSGGGSALPGEDPSSTPTPGGDDPASAPTSGPSDGGSTGTPFTLPSTGPGWDAKKVYIGLPTEKDLSGAVGALGIKFDPGDPSKFSQAVVKYINSHGGVLGRQIEMVEHDNSTAAVTTNPENAAQENCTAFTQDRRVAMVVSIIPALEIAPCLQKAKVPDFELGSVALDTAYYAKYGPYLWTTGFPNNDLLAKGLVNRLFANGFFKGWNTTLGAAGSAAVKVGIYQPDTASGRATLTALTNALKAKGIAVGATFLYQEALNSYGSDARAATLKFAAAKVTHVLNIPPIAAAMLFFTQSAENQKYRPRYGITSYSIPSQWEANFPKAQQSGAMGVGFNPGYDASASRQPAKSAAAKSCDAILRAGGVNETNPLPANNARLFCDSLQLFVSAAKVSGSFAPEAIAAGMAKVGPTFAPAAVFGSMLSATNHWVPGQVRDIAYATACSCFSYSGGNHDLDGS